MYAESLPVVRDLPSPEAVWELVEVIGEGNYGQVYKARAVKSGFTAAVKIMEAVVDKEEDIKSELNVFTHHSQHPNIVKFIGAFLKKDPVSDDQLWLVMEYCAAGSVTDLVKSMKEQGESLSESVIAYILREVLSGISYLHMSCIIHRDIKGQNVLLTSDAQVKLIDFGISAIVDGPSGRRRTAIGTPYWMAPEVIACESQFDYDYDARADVWSLGITAIEIADSTPPHFGENPMRALFKIPKNKAPTVQKPQLWSNQFNGFIANCLVKDFEKRPTSHQLCTHEFVCYVPRKPRMICEKLKSLIDAYSHATPASCSESSTSSQASSYQMKTSLALLTGKMVDDLASLEFIDENVIVAQLNKRYEKKKIYTNVGDILISVNPFQNLDIYNDQLSRLYTCSPLGSLPPHIFAIASRAYFSMVQQNHGQCCVVSGESGSGKTEASNILVQQFMKLGRAKTRSLEEKILKLNPLMESFGNARTVINSNSSRFGKFLELHFTKDGQVVGAHLSEYLLEKSRVVSQARKERNFHIFYYLLAGLGSRGLLANYRLGGKHHQHRYLEQRGTAHMGQGHKSTRREAILSEKFNQIEDIFQLFGFSEQEFDSVCCILAAVVNIGNIRLETDFHSHIGEVSAVKNSDCVHDVAELLQIDANQLLRVLTVTPVVTQGETIDRLNTIVQAMDTRDAIAKALYGRLFSWIVNKINPKLHPHGSDSTHVLSIGILDIFGFENFRSNSFEQLCINVANEQLQFYFNQHVFAWEQEEYEREGINASLISYTDNRPLLDLLISRPMGLLPLLDEESKFPQASDLSLAAKFHEHFKSSTYYRMPKDEGPTFSILHYAGLVTYETAGFLEKNRDTLKLNASKLLESSSNKVVRSLYHTPLSRTGSLSSSSKLCVISSNRRNAPSATPLFNRRAPTIGQHGLAPSGRGRTPLSHSSTMTSTRLQTVSNYFANSLRELMSKMLISKPHFVRCIRPNELKSPCQFQADKVLMQLRHTGVMETTRIRKEGFSHRISFDDFIERYKVIKFKLSEKSAVSPAHCVEILRQANLQDWTIGYSKVFLKYFHVDCLDQLLRKFKKSAIVIQKNVRGVLARRLVLKLKAERRRLHAAILIQSAVRGWSERVHVKRRREDMTRAATVIQAGIKRWLARSHYDRLVNERKEAAITIQSVVRMYLTYKRVTALRRSIPHIQRAIRKKLATEVKPAFTEKSSHNPLQDVQDVQESTSKVVERAFEGKSLPSRVPATTLQNMTPPVQVGFSSNQDHHQMGVFGMLQGKSGGAVPRLTQRALWRPCVVTYYGETEQAPSKPSPRASRAGKITQSARKFFEDLIAQQSGNQSKPVAQQRVREKRAKTGKDSLFHRLLDHFDHLKT